MHIDPIALTLTSGIVGLVMMGMMALSQSGADGSPVPVRWWLTGDALFVVQQALLLLPINAYTRFGLPALRADSMLPLCSALVMASIAAHLMSLNAMFRRRRGFRHEAACVVAVCVATFALLEGFDSVERQAYVSIGFTSAMTLVTCWLVAPQWRRYQGARVLMVLHLWLAISGLVAIVFGQVPKDSWELSAEAHVMPPAASIVVKLIVCTLNTLAFMQMMQERLRERIERLSTTDALTGLLNRRGIEAALTRQLVVTLRERRPLAVALIDLDHFKRINDEFGHPVGDRVLAGFAERLLLGVRAGDSAGRWGGEEFLVVMPNTELHEAVQVLERIRNATGAAPLAAPAPAVTLSAGVCTLGNPGESIERLVQTRRPRALPGQGAAQPGLRRTAAGRTTGARLGRRQFGDGAAARQPQHVGALAQRSRFR